MYKFKYLWVWDNNIGKYVMRFTTEEERDKLLKADSYMAAAREMYKQLINIAYTNFAADIQAACIANKGIVSAMVEAARAACTEAEGLIQYDIFKYEDLAYCCGDE